MAKFTAYATNIEKLVIIGQALAYIFLLDDTLEKYPLEAQEWGKIFRKQKEPDSNTFLGKATLGIHKLLASALSDYHMCQYYQQMADDCKAFIP